MNNVCRLATEDEMRHPFMARVAPLIAFEGTRAIIAGTCVLITPHLAITAKHVLEEIYHHFGFDPSKDKSISLDIYIHQFNTCFVWYVSNTFAWKGTDIAFLKLCPRDKKTKPPHFAPLKMTIDPPTPGTIITGLGYPKSEILIERNDPEITSLKLNLNPTVSSGEVTEVHNTHRDMSMINFPSFSVNARFPSGMSGGAIFNEAKELCGLVCSSLESNEENPSEHYSTVVSIWSSMLIKLIFNDDGHLPPNLIAGREYSALELAQIGYLDVQGYERLEFFKHENGTDGIRRKHLSP